MFCETSIAELYRDVQNAISLFGSSDMYTIDWIDLTYKMWMTSITVTHSDCEDEHTRYFNKKVCTPQQQLKIKTAAAAQQYIIGSDFHITSRIVCTKNNPYVKSKIDQAKQIVDSILADKPLQEISKLRLNCCILYYLNAFTRETKLKLECTFGTEMLLWENPRTFDNDEQIFYKRLFSVQRTHVDLKTLFESNTYGPLWAFNFERFLSYIKTDELSVPDEYMLARVKTYSIAMRNVHTVLGSNYSQIIADLQQDRPNHVLTFFQAQKNLILYVCQNFRPNNLYNIQTAYAVLDCFDNISPDILQTLEKTFDMSLFWTADPKLKYDSKVNGSSRFWTPL